MKSLNKKNISLLLYVYVMTLFLIIGVCLFRSCNYMNKREAMTVGEIQQRNKAAVKKAKQKGSSGGGSSGGGSKQSGRGIQSTIKANTNNVKYFRDNQGSIKDIEDIQTNMKALQNEVDAYRKKQNRQKDEVRNKVQKTEIKGL